MAWLENWPRPYYANYEKILSKVAGWFDVYRLPHDVYCIAEPEHAQEVNAFLIIGKERALLIDTGMGIAGIRQVTDTLYDGELIVANTHCHFDHIGGNNAFADRGSSKPPGIIHIPDHPLPKAIAERGITAQDVGEELVEEAFQFGYPDGFSADKFGIAPFPYAVLKEGDIIDLGGRTIRIVTAPGHSPDSIVFYDETNNIMWAGDLVYLGGIYTHIESDLFGKSNIHDYLASLNKLAGIAGEDTLFYTSHNDLIMKYPKFLEIRDAFAQVIEVESDSAKDATDKTDTELADTEIENDHADGTETAPHVHAFDGFSIYCTPGLH